MILFVRCFCSTQCTASVVFLCFGLQESKLENDDLSGNQTLHEGQRYTYILQRTFELKIQITKHSRRPEITQKYFHPKSRNKLVFHDVYIRPKGTELSFPWRIYRSRGSSDWIVVGAYYGRIIITPGLKGLMVMVYVKYLWQNSIVWKHNYHNRQTISFLVAP